MGAKIETFRGHFATLSVRPLLGRPREPKDSQKGPKKEPKWSPKGAKREPNWRQNAYKIGLPPRPYPGALWAPKWSQNVMQL